MKEKDKETPSTESTSNDQEVTSSLTSPPNDVTATTEINNQSNKKFYSTIPDKR